MGGGCCWPHTTASLLQPSVQTLRERAEPLFLRSAASAMQLEHAQALLAQFSEAHEELAPWLQETQLAAARLCPHDISYEAFKEQQGLLQVRGPGPMLQGARLSRAGEGAQRWQDWPGAQGPALLGADRAAGCLVMGWGGAGTGSWARDGLQGSGGH